MARLARRRRGVLGRCREGRGGPSWASLSPSRLSSGTERSTARALDDGQASEREQADAKDRESIDELFTRVLGENWEASVPSPEAVLELQRALWARETYKDALEGRPIKVSQDTVIRSIDATTRRKANEETSILLRGIGSAVGGFVAGVLEPPPELVEGEVVAEEEL